MRKKTISKIFLALLPLFFLACKGFQFDEKKKLSDSVWSYKDSLEYSFEISDTSHLYNIYLELVHEAAFRTQNLYTKLYVTFPDAKEKDQLISLELADNRGEWLGNCSAEKCTRRFTLIPNASFKLIGKYKMKFEQFSRQEKINGIESLRLIVEKIKDKKENSNNNKKKVS